ncbi:MAG: heme-copper oxidase subunit III [Planctomycetes bacterium]|nr:heme-copper oxidase subunit III [Planctomycetota bacterium]
MEPARDEFWPPIEKGRAVPGADRFGFWLMVLSLGIPFAVVIGVFIHMRLRSPEWINDVGGGVPPILWASTACLLVVSFFAHRAVTAMRIDEVARVRRALWLTSLFAAVFGLCQVVAWEEMRSAYSSVSEDLRRYKASFYLLTGFHALHVLGGWALQAWVVSRFLRGRYWSLHHPGLRYAAWYWHFLDVTWIAIFVALHWGDGGA